MLEIFYHKIRPDGDSFADVYLAHAQIHRGVIVHGIIADSPPHVHNLQYNTGQGRITGQGHITG